MKGEKGADPLSVRCPKCYAGRGEQCELSHSRSSNDPFAPPFALRSHTERVRAAREVRSET
jgi:hypothetical protein